MIATHLPPAGHLPATQHLPILAVPFLSCWFNCLVHLSPPQPHPGRPLLVLSPASWFQSLHPDMPGCLSGLGPRVLSPYWGWILAPRDLSRSSCPPLQGRQTPPCLSLMPQTELRRHTVWSQISSCPCIYPSTLCISAVPS